MSDLTHLEKRRFERLLVMGGGYVLDFSNRTFDEFISDSTGRNIYDSRYGANGGSKANRLRGFWQQENNPVVGKLLGDLLNYGVAENLFTEEQAPGLLEECRKTITRLLQASTVQELESLTAITTDKDFDVVVRAVKDAIDKNQPEAGLDRLHTFATKYVRALCNQRGIAISRDKPLHSLFGEYVKSLRDGGNIESVMTERILKSSISILEAFNDIRNNRSLAHDNAILNYEEALLIFNQVAISVRFIRSVEDSLRRTKASPSEVITDDDIQF